VLLAFCGGLLAHISVNTFNEYFDFRSGLDQNTHKTPFSGGSGALVQSLHAQDAKKAAKYVLFTAILSALLTFLIGVYFVSLHGTELIPLGLFGLLIVVSYTRWLNKLPFACWISPGLGFGPLMIVGTYFVLTGTYSMTVLWTSLIPMLLANNLLLLNQFPDVEADKLVGRNHIPIAFGLVFSARLYGFTALCAMFVLIVLCYSSIIPMVSLAALVILLPSLLVYKKALSYSRSVSNKNAKHQSEPASAIPSKVDQEQLQGLLPYMGMNVAVTLLGPMLLGLCIVLA
jgi:1,4-dihydroxy-2-naphthoate octaprenyltransferase